MTTATKYSVESLGWQRKSGPTRVWRAVESTGKTIDGKTLRFSIQEIPEDRHADVLKLMSTVFTIDEPLCVCTGVINDPAALADWHKVWNFALQQGIVVGAFVIDDNNPKPILAGCNMIIVNCDATERGFAKELSLNSGPFKKIMAFMSNLDAEMNVRKLYNVDKYLTAYGLCVAREYRKMGLGYHLLAARDDIALAYDIPATSTVFSNPGAQKAALRAGFVTLIERDFADVRANDGEELFPGITAKRCWLSGKRFL